MAAMDKHEADWVIGSRQGTGSPGSFIRRIGSFCMGAIARHKGIVLQDLSSGFWAMKPSAVSTILSLLDEDCVDANIRVLVARQGIEIIETSTPMPDRYQGESMHKGLKTLQHGMMSAWKLLCS